jgi:hypothetical protein
MGEIQAAKYLKLCDAKGYDLKLVERIEKKYRDALVVTAGDDKAALFNAVICNETEIYLNFDSGVPFATKRRVGNKAAATLGYHAKYSEQI